MIREIKSFAKKPVSAAIGDFPYKPGGASLAAYGAACTGADYVKIGLAFPGKAPGPRCDRGGHQSRQRRFPEKFVVITGYSDYERMGSISPFEIAPLTAACGADYVMVDTGIKDGRSTFSFMDEATLIRFTEGNRALGLGTALAGSLVFADIDALKRINPEIIECPGDGLRWRPECDHPRRSREDSTGEDTLVKKIRCAMYLNKLDVPLSLTFDDVLLEPLESWIEPAETDTRTRFSKNIGLNIPLVSSAMDTVTESTMAIALAREGGIGVIHRNMTAEHELQQVNFVKQAEGLIERDVLYVEETATVSDAEKLMNQYSIGGVPVIGKGKIIGIVSRRDVRAIVSRRGEESIRTIMTKKPITAGEDITPEKALEVMYTNKVERLPVADSKGRLIGIITMQDILEKRQYPRATRDKKGNLQVAAAVGPFDFTRATLLDAHGVDALVVDCAHGHNMKVVEAVKNIKGSVSADVIAGNIATTAAAEALLDAGVDGIKVGIGPG